MRENETTVPEIKSSNELMSRLNSLTNDTENDDYLDDYEDFVKIESPKVDIKTNSAQEKANQIKRPVQANSESVRVSAPKMESKPVIIAASPAVAAQTKPKESSARPISAPAKRVEIKKTPAIPTTDRIQSAKPPSQSHQSQPAEASANREKRLQIVTKFDVVLKKEPSRLTPILRRTNTEDTGSPGDFNPARGIKVLLRRSEAASAIVHDADQFWRHRLREAQLVLKDSLQTVHKKEVRLCLSTSST